MSLTGRTTPSPSNLPLIINALANYAKQTEIDFANNPFFERIKLLNSPEAILELLQERESAFRQYREGNRRLISRLSPAVEVIHVLSGILGEAVSLPFSPAKAVFTGIDVLLAAASGVTSSYDALLELFERLGNFLKRLKIYTTIPPTSLMMDIIIKVMAELLSVLALATKQIKQGRIKKFFTKLIGKSEVEAMLQKLDRLTQDESRMAVTETLGVVHGLAGDMRVVLEDGEASTDSIHEILSEMNKMKRDQLQRDVQHWLSPPDPSTNHDFVWKAHHTGTASWFLKSDTLSQWKKAGSFLWIHGKPGSGKSTLLSAIIEDIEGICAAGLATMAYYYFDFRDVKKQDRYGLLASLLSQLSAKSDSGFDALCQLYSKHTSGTGKLTTNALTTCLKDMLSLPGQGPIYIIVDALDECPDVSGTPSAREEVLKLIQELVGSKLSNLHLCVASRPESDIRKSLEPLEPLQISLHDEKGQKVDILKYIKSVVRSDTRMKNWREKDKQLAIKVLSERADGMFRWVVCQFDSLRRSQPASIRSALANLPESLDKTYEKALLGIDKEKQIYAKRLFQCLLVSFRPLRVEELAEILAVEFDSTSAPSFNEDLRSEDAEEAVLSACSSLVAIADKEGGQIVQFSHYSVKEFLTSDRLATAEECLSCYHILPEPAHTLLALAGLSVLLRLDNKINRRTIGRFPLAPYAARYWVDHAKFKNGSSRIEEVMEPLFDPTKPHFAAWVWLYDIDHPWVVPMSSMRPMRPEAVPLYYAALCGFGGLVERLLGSLSLDIDRSYAHIRDIDLSDITRSLFSIIWRLFLFKSLGINRGSNSHTTLSDPPPCGFGLIGHFLVSISLEISSRGGSHATPLEAALCRFCDFIGPSFVSISFLIYCNNGLHTTPLQASLCLLSGLMGRLIVWFLLDFKSWGDSRTTLLHAALYRLLVSFSLDTNCKGGSHATPLHAATVKGHVEVVSLLLKSGANPNRCDNMGRVPLHRVTHGGHLVCEKSSLEITRLLIDSGANVNITNNAGWTPLHAAMLNGYCDITKRLLVSGAILEARNNNQQTPLQLACANGKLDVSRFLIDRGSDLKSQDAEGSIPLHSASRHGHVDVAQLLLDRGSNVNAPDTQHRTPLHVASQYGHLGLAQLLIDRRANVDAYTAERWTPLHLASANGRLDIAKLLVKQGANINSQNKEKVTPLHCAAELGHLDVVRFLVESRALVTARDKNSWTPLHKASYRGHLNVVSFFVERGIDVVIRTGTLYMASGSGKHDVVRYLIEHGANIQLKNYKGWDPLHFASQMGHLDVVQILIDSGATVDIRTQTQKTPLAFASREGKAEVGRFLIERGADVNARDEQTRAPLHLATQYGHLDMAKLLLDHGVDPNVQKDNLWSPLHLASAHGHFKVAELLVQRGANVDASNSIQETPLHLAAANGRVEIARLLIDHGANLHAINRDGWTPLHAVSRRGHLEVVKLLLRRGASVDLLNKASKSAAELASENSKDEVARLIAKYKADANIRKKIRSTTLNTALCCADEDRKDGGKDLLHTAAEEGNIEIVKSLLERGMDINGRNASNVTPLHKAAYKGNHDVVRLLIERGAKVDLRETSGWTPLHDASRSGHLEASRVLVEHGANVNARVFNDWTPLDLSVIHGHTRIVKLLLEHGADVHAVNGDGQTPYETSLASGNQEIINLFRERGVDRTAVRANTA